MAIQTKYDFKSRVFPLELGSEDVGHYMVININIPTTTNDINAPATRIPNAQFPFTPLPNERSKVDRLRFPNGTPNISLNTDPNNNNAAWISLPRRTVRIAETIALHMPTPLVFNTQNQYEEISLTTVAGKILGAGASALGSVIGGRLGFGTPEGAARGGAIAGAIAGYGGALAPGVAKLAQSPINPAVEVLFSNTPQRQFTFEVLMAPRNEKESEAAEQIVKTLRYHAAPEIAGAGVGLFGYEIGVGGLFWIPPAEFDISFWNKGKENTKIIGINTCVMERIEVDYAPSGVFSTFSNGHPVAIRLSLGMRELEPIHKLRVIQGM